MSFLSVSFVLVAIFLGCTIETLSYQEHFPQKAGTLFPRNGHNPISKRSLRSLDNEDNKSKLAGLKLKKLARNRRPLVKTSKLKTVLAHDIDRLREAVLDEQKELRRVHIDDYVHEQTQAISDHQVLQLMQERFRTYSTPGNRRDNATLALAVEGGGMRGCVSAGMAAAIATLGLCDVFDAIYGSSAGSVVGAYMISRQMCLDVYVDILPAAKKKFVCKKRLIRSIASNLADVLVSSIKRNNNDSNSMLARSAVNGGSIEEVNEKKTPGMNISYVLDGIMDSSQGLRPLDSEKFHGNDKMQPLRVVSSTVDEGGNMYSKVFGSEDFFDETMRQIQHNGEREGLFACLQASMTVPGATGPPVKLYRSKNKNHLFPCFDAFCFEPIPYRSAVEEGATHVLALCTRPEGCELKTKPGVYEQGVAPLYFKSHGLPKVAEYFEKGGQQYIYAEDILTLEQGKLSPSSKVSVPPPKIYYGKKQSSDDRKEIHERREKWKKAHLLPLKVPSSIPELATLEQDKDAVLEAVRSGFAAAFDILAPVVDVDLDMTGADVSQLIFTNRRVQSDNEEITLRSALETELEADRVMLNTQLRVPGFQITSFENSDAGTTSPRRRRKRERLRSIVFKIVRRKRKNKHPVATEVPSKVTADGIDLAQLDEALHAVPHYSEMAQTLLKSLPGLNGERAHFQHLSKDLRIPIYDGEKVN